MLRCLVHMEVTFIFIIVVVFQITDSAYSPGANKFCLSCQNVQDPHQCTRFVQVWHSEVCTTEKVLLLNGTVIWNLGYEAGITCHSNEVNPVGLMRVRRDSRVDMTVCHECCYTDMCNHKLCGSTSYNGLACLKGDSLGLPYDTDVAYCNQNELCYVSQPSHARPGQFQYACASQSFCNQIPASNPHARCQRCCDVDGCNAHTCNIAPIFADCWDLRARGGYTQNGVYDIYPPPGNARVRVRCDMQTDGGGWLVFHRRYDGSLSFASKTFDDYAEGFGELSHEFWLGLDNVHRVTSHSSPLTLRVDICSRTESYYAEYGTFSIGNRNDSYRLHIGEFRGTIPDRLLIANGADFTVAGRCPSSNGGWWHSALSCGYSYLNGAAFSTGVYWSGSRSSAEMKLRPMQAYGNATRFLCPVVL